MKLINRISLTNQIDSIDSIAHTWYSQYFGSKCFFFFFLFVFFFFITFFSFFSSCVTIDCKHSSRILCVCVFNTCQYHCDERGRKFTENKVSTSFFFFFSSYLSVRFMCVCGNFMPIKWSVNEVIQPTLFPFNQYCNQIKRKKKKKITRGPFFLITKIVQFIFDNRINI